MFLKTINITNARNVLVQVPGYVIADWGARDSDKLEVHYDESTKEVTIRPAVQRRSNFTAKGDGMARATKTRQSKGYSCVR